MLISNKSLDACQGMCPSILKDPDCVVRLDYGTAVKLCSNVKGLLN